MYSTYDEREWAKQQAEIDERNRKKLEAIEARTKETHKRIQKIKFDAEVDSVHIKSEELKRELETMIEAAESISFDEAFGK